MHVDTKNNSEVMDAPQVEGREGMQRNEGALEAFAVGSELVLAGEMENEERLFFSPCLYRTLRSTPFLSSP